MDGGISGDILATEIDNANSLDYNFYSSPASTTGYALGRRIRGTVVQEATLAQCSCTVSVLKQVLGNQWDVT